MRKYVFHLLSVMYTRCDESRIEFHGYGPITYGISAERNEFTSLYYREDPAYGDSVGTAKKCYCRRSVTVTSHF